MKEGEKMIGAAIFLIFFVVFTLISLVINFPPGIWINDWIPEIQGTEYASWVSGIINGVVYGVIIWLVFSLVKMVWDRRKGKKIVLEAEVKK